VHKEFKATFTAIKFCLRKKTVSASTVSVWMLTKSTTGGRWCAYRFVDIHAAYSQHGQK